MLRGFRIGYHEVKYMHGAFWLKIFHHDMSTGEGFNSPEEAQYIESDYKYSILNDLDSTYKIGEKFEFLLDYPETKEYNRWKQNNNPLEESEHGQDVAEGFVTIHTGLPRTLWGGLVRTNQSFRACLLNGSPKNPTNREWWFAIGMYKGVTWNYGKFTKLPANVGDKEYNEVFLWVRIPNCKFEIKEKHSHITNLIVIILFSVL